MGTQSTWGDIYGQRLKGQVEERLRFYETGDLPRKNEEVMAEALVEATEFLKAQSKKKKKKKKKHSVVENGDVESPIVKKKKNKGEEAEAENEESPKKKKKKNKQEELVNGDEMETETPK